MESKIKEEKGKRVHEGTSGEGKKRENVPT
jgi:hypothetical protein